MKIADIKKLQVRKPFRPFAIHLTSGEVLPVGHPEQLSISPDVDDLFSLWTGPEWNLVDLSTVSRISIAGQKDRESKRLDHE